MRSLATTTFTCYLNVPMATLATPLLRALDLLGQPVFGAQPQQTDTAMLSALRGYTCSFEKTKKGMSGTF